MKKKKIKIICAVILICIMFFVTDLARANMNESPVFALPLVQYNDGGSRECYGIGYKVNVYVYSDIEHFGKIECVDIGTWFLLFNK